MYSITFRFQKEHKDSVPEYDNVNRVFFFGGEKG